MTGSLRPLAVPRATRRVPPGPPRRKTFSMLKNLFTDRLALMSDAAKYGDVVRVAIGPKSLYLVNHPEHAKHVLADNAGNYVKGIGQREARQALGDGLLTSDGETWRRQRHTIQPAFQHRRIAARAGAVASEVDDLVRRLRGGAATGPVEILREMTALTLGVLGRTLLEAELGGYTSLEHSFEAVQDQALFDAVTLGAVPRFLPLPKRLRFRTGRDDLRRVADELIARRRAEPVDGGEDVLSRLLGTPGSDATRIRDELITLLLAGHETTASTLSWAFHLIDEHPGVGERLRAEAVDVLGDRLPTFEDVHRLRYTSMVVEEVMRLFPPVWLLPRTAREPDVLGGFDIPAGADVVVVPYCLHRHPDYWTEPERFDPLRFAPDRQSGRPRYAYIPFGAGPRFCIGNGLGMMEAVFVLAQVSRELRLAKLPGYRVVPEAMLSLRVRGGLPMTAHAVSRTSAVDVSPRAA